MEKGMGMAIFGAVVFALLLLTIKAVREFVVKWILLIAVVSFPFIGIFSTMEYGAAGYFTFVGIFLVYGLFFRK